MCCLSPTFALLTKSASLAVLRPFDRHRSSSGLSYIPPAAPRSAFAGLLEPLAPLAPLAPPADPRLALRGRVSRFPRRASSVPVPPHLVPSPEEAAPGPPGPCDALVVRPARAAAPGVSRGLLLPPHGLQYAACAPCVPSKRCSLPGWSNCPEPKRSSRRRLDCASARIMVLSLPGPTGAQRGPSLTRVGIRGTKRPRHLQRRARLAAARI